MNTFSLASRGYNTANTEQSVQLTETAVLSKKVVNEIRFQFIHQVADQNGDDSIPTINVLDAFQGGGAGVGLARTRRIISSYRTTRRCCWDHSH